MFASAGHLAAGAVHVWWGRRQDASPGLTAFLDDTERERWAAYRREEDRQRFVVGCALAKAALASYGYGGHPAEVRLERSCAQCGKPHGKPRVTDTDLELSVSHSGDRIAVAVARVTPVGVDVERGSRPGRGPGGADQQALERYVLSDAEIAAVEREQPDPDLRRRYFLVTWTRKEAVTKATGDGLRVSFREVIVSSPAGPPAVLAWPYPQPPQSVSLFDLDSGDGYLAALAVIGRCEAVLSRSGTALLEAAAL